MKKRLPRTTTVDDVRQAAIDARDAGEHVFTPSFRMAITSTNPDFAPSWGPMIDAVEAEGWHLTHWAVTVAVNVAAFPVFRRA